MIQKLRGRLLNFLTPFVQWWGALHFPFTHKKVTGRHYYNLRKKLKPGAIFLTKIRGEMTNLLIPGDWTHAALYYGDELVIESIGRGVVKTDLVSFLLSKDYVIILEPIFYPEKQPLIMELAASIALVQVGALYDYQFEYSPSDNKAFYCSELVWFSYDKACEGYQLRSPFEPRETLGVPTITPMDIALATKKFVKVWDSREL